jgi:DNA-binding transcriptional ArsR family regulator
MPDRAAEAAGLYKLLGNPTRIRICRMLADEGELKVGDLVSRLKSNQPSVSHDLALLKAVGIVEGRRDGRAIMYSLTPATRGRLAAAVLYPFGLEAMKIPKLD